MGTPVFLALCGQGPRSLWAETLKACKKCCFRYCFVMWNSVGTVEKLKGLHAVNTLVAKLPGVAKWELERPPA